MFPVRLGDPKARSVNAHSFSNHFFVSKAALDGGRCPDPMAVKGIDTIEVLATAATEAAGTS